MRLGIGSGRIQQHRVSQPQLPLLAPVHLVFHMWKRGIYIYRYILHIFWRPEFFFGGRWWSWGTGKGLGEVTARLARGHSLWNSANLNGGRFQPAELSVKDSDTGGRPNPQGCLTQQLSFFQYTHTHFKPYLCTAGLGGELVEIRGPFQTLCLQHDFLSGTNVW